MDKEERKILRMYAFGKEALPEHEELLESYAVIGCAKYETGCSITRDKEGAVTNFRLFESICLTKRGKRFVGVNPFKDVYYTLKKAWFKFLVEHYYIFEKGAIK